MEELDLEIEQIESDLKEDEMKPERGLDRQETKRKLGRLKNLRDLTALDGVTSHEEILEREVAMLRERNQQLVEDNKKLHWMITGDTAKGHQAGTTLQMSSEEDGGGEGAEVSLQN